MPAIHPHILRLGKVLNCNVFIESGTFLGTTFCTAVESGLFERVYSVEIQEDLYRNANQLYRGQGAFRVFWGKSHDVFVRHIFPLCKPDDRIFFWLDGHYSMSTTGGAQDPCPLLDELSAIRDACPTASIVIAIDDTDDFGMHDEDVAGLRWPSRSQVEELALQINPSFVTIDCTGSSSQSTKLFRGVLVFAFDAPPQIWQLALPYARSLSVVKDFGMRMRSALRRRICRAMTRIGVSRPRALICRFWERAGH